MHAAEAAPERQRGRGALLAPAGLDEAWVQGQQCTSEEEDETVGTGRVARGGAGGPTGRCAVTIPGRGNRSANAA
ncbi:hypothetical protein B7486_64655 [cyanobacterium TDX16]|nr:hypothetical protein B7486_64655 [cyanobacterium TDX16]